MLYGSLPTVSTRRTGIELQDRELFAAIREGPEPNASVAQVLPCYAVLHHLEQQLDAARGSSAHLVRFRSARSAWDA